MPDPMPRKITKSGVRETASGKTVRHVTKNDLLAQLVANGVIADEQDMLARSPQLTQVVMRTWLASGHTSCLYSNVLGTDEHEGLWGSATIAREVEQDVFDSLITAQMSELGRKEIALLTFPYVTTEPDLAQLVGQLAASPEWSWEDRSRPSGLRWRLPDGEHVSWALGFGPFPWMPFTRRAPYTSLVLRARPEAHTVPAEAPGPDGLRGVHLAHVPQSIDRGEFGGPVWTTTEGMKRMLLWADLTKEAQAVSLACSTGAYDEAGQSVMRDAWTALAPHAKAKVTFVLQRHHADQIATGASNG